VLKKNTFLNAQTRVLNAHDGKNANISPFGKLPANFAYDTNVTHILAAS